ncbi:Nucleotidyl transferase, putative [Leishmania guyanensis]
MSSDTAASCLLDIVVFAGGDSLDLMPLTAVEQKTMLRICNRPLIWYSITPWIEAGFRSFFLCVNEDYATLRAYLSRAFDGVDFHYILVPSNVGDHPSTTCDAVKAYLKYKEALRLGEEDTLAQTSGGALNCEDTVINAEGSGCHFPQVASLHETQLYRGASESRNHGGCANPINRDPLKLERMNSAGLPRDALLLSCDTILVDVDVASFVERHYASLASVTAMLYRPLCKRGGGGSGGDHKVRHRHGKDGGIASVNAAEASYTHGLSCVAYEEADALASMALGATSNTPTFSCSRRLPSGALSQLQRASASLSTHSPCEARTMAADLGHVHHHRMHYLNPLEGKPEVRITMAFAARRPDMTFAADVVDAHAYLMNRWVLEFIAESAGVADMTVRKDILPLLARSQHTTVNTSERAFATPAEKLKVNVPHHWLSEGAGISAQSLNAACGLALPEVADSLRVFCSIYEEDPDKACRVYRMNTRDNYRALNDDIISAKCSQLHLEEPLLNAGGAAGPGGAGGGGTGVVNRFTLPSLLPHGGAHPGHYGGTGGAAHGDSSKPAPSAGAMALATLLPDNPITLRERVDDQQVYIVGSFIDSVPPPNVFVTRSVIGAHVTLEPGARITDSILMGNVEVGAKAVVLNSVIGTGAVVNAGCRVVGTTVGPRCVVEENASDTIIE